MKLSDLRPNPGATHPKKRVGRGIGSGHGKTSTRGSKGQHARNTVRPGFEGGQTPLHRRLPRRRGFTNTFQKKYAIINVGDLGDRFEPGTLVTPELLVERRIVRNLHDGLKVLGDGELPHPLTIRAHKFSKAALEKQSACGDSREVDEHGWKPVGRQG